MRLAVFTSQFPGLINTFFARDARGLIDAGIDVEVFACHPLKPEWWVHVPDILSAAVLPRTKVHHASLTASLMRIAMWHGAWRQAPAITAVAGSAIAHGAEALFKTAYVVPKALDWARRHKSRFDHVLAYWGNYAATCAYVFHRAAGRDIPFSTFLHAGTDLYRSRVYLPQKLTYADNIIVVCDFNRRFLQATYPQQFEQFAPKVYLHHIGVDLDALHFSEAGRLPNRLIAAGGLHASKGFDDLLRAGADLHRRGHRADIVLVGGGPESEALTALARQLGIESSVRFLGWQSPDRVVAEIRQATLLVHPSIGLGDAVPTVIKEAMAVGTPVVASAVAGIPELLDGGRCGVLTRPRDPRGLADAIVNLLEATEKRATYAISARAHAEKLFSQARNGAALAERLFRSTRRVARMRSDSALARSQSVNP
jgi:glycosyltransferase involved in cell wall biosynthesis